MSVSCISGCISRFADLLNFMTHKLFSITVCIYIDINFDPICIENIEMEISEGMQAN